MIMKKWLYLFIVVLFATPTISSCKLLGVTEQSPDSPQPQSSPTSTPSTSEVIPAVNISAITIPDFNVTEEQIEDHPGGVPFKIILNVDPVQPDDLNSDVMEAYSNRTGPGYVGFIRELIGPAEPLQAEFPLFSDGSLYWLFDSDPEEDRIAVLTPGDFMSTGDDVTFTYAVWTQLSPDEDSDSSTNRVWFNSFTLDSNSNSFYSDETPQAYLDEDYSEPKTNPIVITVDRQFTSQFTRNAQYWFGTDLPETVGDADSDAKVDPLDLIPEIINIPVVPIITINRVDIRPDVDADMDVSPSDLANLWDLEYVPINISLEPPPGVDVFNTNMDIHFDNENMYYDYFLASAGVDASGEPADAADLAYGFPHIANFVDEDPGGSSDCDEGPEVGSFGFVSDGLCFSSVFSLPIDKDSLFSPLEPHTIESGTIWLYCEEKEDHLNIYVEDGYIPDTVVTVGIDPEGSGEVDLTVNAENKEPDAEVMFEKYTWYFEKGSFQTESETKEVTLTAIPEPGYCFSHWEKVAETGTYVTEFDLEGYDMNSATITFEIELGHFFHRNTYGLIAHFEPLSEEPTDQTTPEPPSEPVPSVVEISTSLDANGQCWASQSFCSCNMVIVIEGTDLTDGSYPVTNVSLTVNGANWHDSGAISETHYSRTVERSVNCDAEFNIEVTAINSIGQTVSATGYVSTVRN